VPGVSKTCVRRLTKKGDERAGLIVDAEAVVRIDAGHAELHRLARSHLGAIEIPVPSVAGDVYPLRRGRRRRIGVFAEQPGGGREPDRDQYPELDGADAIGVALNRGVIPALTGGPADPQDHRVAAKD
jgi:hypothetical protein